MESQRTFFIFGLALVTFLLYQQWQIDNAPVLETPSPAAIEQSVDSVNPDSISNDLPQSDSASFTDTNSPVNTNLISVSTDVLDVKIDPKGGDVVSAVLLEYNAEFKSKDKFVLLKQKPDTYVAQSGLIGKNGPDASPNGRPIYSSTKSEWNIEGDTLRVPLTYKTDSGLTITKTFVFAQGAHSINVEYTIVNNSQDAVEVQPFYQLKQTVAGKEASMVMPTYRGSVYSTADEAYEKYDFDDIVENGLNESTQGGWVAMIQHYFVSAWVPSQTVNNKIYTRAVNNGEFAIIGIKSPIVTVASGATEQLNSTLFAGPKNQEELVNIHQTLDLTVDYGFLWFISQLLFSGLVTIYGFVGNWGIAIIIITIIVKSILYPLTKKQYESMAKMRNLAPKMEQLKQRFGDDRQKFGQATMELYKKEKVNPMGGCLPLLLQMPIFLALYWVFLESVELRHAPFGLWIEDLSAKDPYFILPVLFGASMFLMQKLSPTPTADPMQQKMMLWMPVIFSVFFLWFPSGLVLYWLVSNLISIAQMLYIYRALDKKGITKK